MKTTNSYHRTPNKKPSAGLASTPHGRQKEIAEAVGISPTRLNNLVKGRRGSDEDLRRAICQALGIRDYEQFVFGEGLEGPDGKIDPELVEFLDLYRRYSSRAFLASCRDRLLAIKDLVER